MLASASFTLGEAVEHLELTGEAAIDATGNALANRLLGNRAANRISGAAGDDTLDGGARDGADDTLEGGEGADTYLFGRTAGNDTVSDTGTRAGDLDVLRMGAGIGSREVALRRLGQDLLLTVGAEDSLRITGYFDPTFLAPVLTMSSISCLIPANAGASATYCSDCATTCPPTAMTCCWAAMAQTRLIR